MLNQVDLATNIFAPLIPAVKTIAIGVIFFILGLILFLYLFGLVNRIINKLKKKV